MMNYKYYKLLAFQLLFGYIFKELDIKIETIFFKKSASE